MGLTYAIAIVLPVVTTFFLMFGFLEDSGYIPRLAIFSDRLFRAMGLNGKAVLPMVKTRLFTSQIVLQIVVGTLVPLALLGLTQVTRMADRTRVRLYVVAGVLTLVGILAMRWNVVIGGQLFSKSFLGYTSYKMGFATREGLLPAILVMLLPLGILAVLVKLLPPWTSAETHP